MQPVKQILSKRILYPGPVIFQTRNLDAMDQRQQIVVAKLYPSPMVLHVQGLSHGHLEMADFM